MIKKTLYITENGVLYRKENTLYFQNTDKKIVIPISNFSDIFCIGKVTIKSGASYYLMENKILVHFFNKYGYYIGSLYPREYLLSGKILVCQAKYYLNNNLRLKIANEMLNGIIHNISKILRYYNINVPNFKHIFLDEIDKIRSEEAKYWKILYGNIEKIVNNKFLFDQRVRNPPNNEINALISFGNSLLYAICLTEIYNSFLNPAISYIHEPSERRFSLALDIADIFKPLLVFRTIFYIVNKNILDKSDFSKFGRGILLNKTGKKKFLKIFNEKLETTVKHKKLKRNVSYRRLIRLECYKLIKQILDDEEYVSFKLWW